MIKPELYKRTVDILVDAYFKDTLEHGTCAACAVGNIIAANLGIPILKNEKGWLAWNGEDDNPIWFQACMIGHARPEKNIGEVKKLIDASGYSLDDVAKIERAFEDAHYNGNDDAYMFGGLMAVIEVLDQIHQNTDTELTKSTKQKFVKA